MNSTCFTPGRNFVVPSKVTSWGKHDISYSQIVYIPGHSSIWRQSYTHSQWEKEKYDLVSPKKKGEYFLHWEHPHLLDIHRLMDHKRSFAHFDFIIRVNMLFYVRRLFMPTTKTSQRSIILTWFRLRNWIEIQSKGCECNQLYSPESPRSQNLWSSHNAVGILFKKKHILHLVQSPPKKNIKHELSHNHPINPKHAHPLPCIGPYGNTCRKPLDLFLRYLTKQKF